MTHSFYVYYRVSRENEAAAAKAVSELFDELSEGERVRGRLLKRADDTATWMEVYEGVTQPQTFVSRLQATAQRVELEALAENRQRHIEHFTSLGTY